MYNKLHDFVIIATHKRYPFPNDPIYLPVHAGSINQPDTLPYQQDHIGNNISILNPFFCELTALYWAWKNTESVSLGLVHYRRYFKESFGRRAALSTIHLSSLLGKYPVILPKKRHYWIETNRSQYIHAHGSKSLSMTRDIISQYHPKYLTAFDCSMKKSSGHRFNMFIMRRQLADDYCEWLFDILFKLRDSILANDPEVQTPRLYGFISERLLDCWIETNKYHYKELPVWTTESQHWIKKTISFLHRKFKSSPD